MHIAARDHLYKLMQFYSNQQQLWFELIHTQPQVVSLPRQQSDSERALSLQLIHSFLLNLIGDQFLFNLLLGFWCLNFLLWLCCFAWFFSLEVLHGLQSLV